MASQERFELPTDGLEGRCSILLSYWDIILISYLEDIFYYSRQIYESQQLFRKNIINLASIFSGNIHVLIARGVSPSYNKRISCPFRNPKSL
jgi:hypothetical protein